MTYASAKRLHHRPVQHPGGRLDAATLFPFFDRQGSILHFLLVDAEQGQAWTFARGAVGVRLPVFKNTIQIDAAPADLSPLDASGAARLAELWHFDPWWLLDEPPFKSLAFTPHLKATNCVDFLDVKSPNVGFRRDLSRVTWVFRDAADARVGSRWRPDHLPAERPTLPALDSYRTRTDWVLDPIWERP